MDLARRLERPHVTERPKGRSRSQKAESRRQKAEGSLLGIANWELQIENSKLKRETIGTVRGSNKPTCDSQFAILNLQFQGDCLLLSAFRLLLPTVSLCTSRRAPCGGWSTGYH